MHASGLCQPQAKELPCFLPELYFCAPVEGGLPTSKCADDRERTRAKERVCGDLTLRASSFSGDFRDMQERHLVWSDGTANNLNGSQRERTS